MKSLFIKFPLFVLAASLVFTSCKKDEEGEENDEEVITTMQLNFVPISGGTTLTYQFDDVDGPGGTAPTQQEIVLAPNRSYNVTVTLLNKTANPVEDVTTEVASESDAHRFYYQPSASSNITVTGLNNDAAGIPLGITSTWATGAAGTGNIIITLRHYPGNPPGKAAGDPVDSPKSGTDIGVTFVTRVQ